MLLSCVVNFYSAGIVTRDRKIGSWTQSYNRELQRQRCKNLQEHFLQHQPFWNQIIFSSTLKNAPAYYSAGLEAINSKFAGLAPGYENVCT
jgi:hypothetical protein